MRALAVLLAAVLLAACGGGDDDGPAATGPPETEAPAETAPAGDPEVETVATGLEAPWAIAFLPDGRALVTERPGRVRMLAADGRLRDDPVAQIEVQAVGEGGLHGIALAPDFSDSGHVFLYRTTASDNEVVRYTLEGDALTGERVVVDGIPAGTIHNGGRIAFGPDDRLYIATGDAGEPRLAQDRESAAGKILRVDADDLRGDEAVRPEVVSIGHRNPQGFDWHPEDGRLVATEHGATRNDEVNVIEEDGNYGWPEVEGADHGDFDAPVRVWEDMTIAPSGAAFVPAGESAWAGDYVLAGLRGEQLRRLRIEGDEVTDEEALLDGEYGRLRAVAAGPDDALYVLTNNRDGRGDPAAGDDRILRVTPP
jgi:aldose sugar dehydrogenase